MTKLFTATIELNGEKAAVSKPLPMAQAMSWIMEQKKIYGKLLLTRRWSAYVEIMSEPGYRKEKAVTGKSLLFLTLIMRSSMNETLKYPVHSLLIKNFINIQLTVVIFHK